MGVVHLAHDPRLGRQVAVKTYSLPPGLTQDAKREFQERFLREARAAAALSHPGIVTIYDADEDPELGVSFIAMEHVPGRSLKDILQQQGRLEPGRAFEIARLLAEALFAAHESGVVHRDIKPANILIREGDGAPKIADFGVARIAGSELTRDGGTLGSPAYMSPEQIRGGPVGPQSDLFSLAVILYECLCGERPFKGEDLPALGYAIASETPVPVTKRVDSLSSGIDLFFERALAKDPSARFPSGTAWSAALAEAERGETSSPGEATIVESARGISLPAAPERTGRGRRRPWLIAAVILVASAWGLYWSQHRKAYLKLDGKSNVKAGTLTLLVDREQVYSRVLRAPAKSGNVFTKVLGKNQETFQAWIGVAPGKREVMALVATDGGGAGYKDSVVVDLEPGETRRLNLVAGRTFGSPLSVEVD